MLNCQSILYLNEQRRSFSGRGQSFLSGNGRLFSFERVNIMKKEGQVRIPSGCAISAVISREGRRVTGEKIMESMVPMHDRSNGLGGGFAGYGI